MYEGGGAEVSSEQGGCSVQRPHKLHAQASASQHMHVRSSRVDGINEADEALQGRGTCMISPVLSAKLEADLAQAPSAEIQHYFVDVDDKNPDLRDEAAGLNPDIIEPHSLTRFLTLPTVTTRINPKKQDPIVNFAKSVILILDQYVEAAHQMRTRREETATTKVRSKEERVKPVSTGRLRRRRP